MQYPTKWTAQCHLVKQISHTRLPLCLLTIILPLTVKQKWAPLGESRISCDTVCNKTEKNEKCCCKQPINWCKYSLQIVATDRWNQISYFYYTGEAGIGGNLECNSQTCLSETDATLVKPCDPFIFFAVKLRRVLDGRLWFDISYCQIIKIHFCLFDFVAGAMSMYVEAP